MSFMPFSYPIFKAFTTTGSMGPLSGGKLWTYAAGTSTPQAAYQDEALTVPHTNPIVLDANGQATIYLGPNPYKMTLMDASNVIQPGWPIDDIAGLSAPSGAGKIGFLSSLAYAAGTVGKFLKDLGTSVGASMIGVKAPFTGAVATTQDQVNREWVSVFRWFTPAQIASVQAGFHSVADGGVDVTAAVQSAINSIPVLPVSHAYGYRVGLYFPPGVYIISSVVMNRWASIRGAGRFATVISAQDTNPTYGATFYATGLQGNPLEFSDLQIANLISPSSVGSGWHIQGCSSVYIHDVWLGGLSNGVWMDTNCTDNDIYDSTMENMQGCGIYMQGGDLNRINNVEIVQPGDYGIFMTTGTATSRMPTGAPFGNLVNNCHIQQTNKHGVYINQGQNNLVANCNFDNCGHNQGTSWGVYDCIHIVGGINNIIDGNTSSQEVAVGYTLNGISIDSTSSGNVVTGNNFEASIVKPLRPFTGIASCSGSTLTVTNTYGNTIYCGQKLVGLAGAPTILLYGTSGTNGTGGIGTYALSSAPGTVASGSQLFQGGTVVTDLGTGTIYSGNYKIPDKSPSYTIATLPAGVDGQRVYCSDARCPVGPMLRGDGTTVAFAPSPNGKAPSGAVLTLWTWQGQQPQYPTARTNLGLQSRTFNSPTWTKYNCTINTAATTAPDGTLTAQAVVDNTTNTSHYLLQSNIAIGASGSPYTFAIDVKAGAINQFNIVPSGACFSAGHNSWFDMTTLTIQNSGGCVGELVPIEGAPGWYRASITLTSIAAGSQNVYINCMVNGSSIYAGAASEALYFDNFQVEIGPVATSRIITTTVAVAVTDYSLTGGVATFITAPPAGSSVYWSVAGGSLIYGAGAWRRKSDLSMVAG